VEAAACAGASGTAGTAGTAGVTTAGAGGGPALGARPVVPAGVATGVVASAGAAIAGAAGGLWMDGAIGIGAPFGGRSGSRARC